MQLKGLPIYFMGDRFLLNAELNVVSAMLNIERLRVILYATAPRMFARQPKRTHGSRLQRCRRLLARQETRFHFRQKCSTLGFTHSLSSRTGTLEQKPNPAGFPLQGHRASSRSRQVALVAVRERSQTARRPASRNCPHTRLTKASDGGSRSSNL